MNTAGLKKRSVSGDKEAAAGASVFFRTTIACALENAVQPAPLLC